MRIPDVLKIGGREVSVRVLPIDPGLLGQYNPSKLEILLNSAIENRSLLEETFFHEMWHAVHDFVRLEREIQRELDDAAEEGEVELGTTFNLEEQITESTSKVFYHVLKSNNLLS